MRDSRPAQGPWAQLPSELIHHIASSLAGVNGCSAASAATPLRLCCKHWRDALPLGLTYPAKLWDWQPDMERALSPHTTRHLELLAPLPLPKPSACPLARITAGPLRCALRTLRLHHIAASALPCLSELRSLTGLEATVHFSSAQPDWLDFATELTALRRLSLRAAVLRLQPEEGLTALLWVRHSLRCLHVKGCMLLTDEGASALAQLSKLRELEVTPCGLGQAGIDALAGGLTQLRHVELRLHDGVAPHSLLLRGTDCRLARMVISDGEGEGLGSAKAPVLNGQEGMPPTCAMESLTAHVSRVKAPGLLATCQLVPGMKHLKLLHNGGVFLLTAQPALTSLAQSLESLSLPSIQLTCETAAQLATCTRLRHLTAELHFGVRDQVFLAWTSLQQLTSLDLRGNYYLTDHALATVLAAMPHMRSLTLGQLQGTGGGLAPLSGMRNLHQLKLTDCHLTDARQLAAALSGPAASLQSLSIQACGVQRALCEAVVAAAAVLRLGQLELVLLRAPGPDLACQLAAACAACSTLTALDIHFPGHTGPVPAAPGWAALALSPAAPRLRRLHVSTGLGWQAEGFAALCAAATGLRQLVLTDNAGGVADSWLAGLDSCRQLSKLDLSSCKGLSPVSLSVLQKLTALTSFTAYRCPGLGRPDVVVHALREALPRLALATVHE